MVFGLFKSSGGRSGDSSALTAEIQSTISSHPVVIYSKSFCPYCDRTKNLFRSSYPGVTPHVLELDVVSGGSSIQGALLKMTGQRSVPNVFVGGQHVGGNDDTHEAHRTGRLGELLAAK